MTPGMAFVCVPWCPGAPGLSCLSRVLTTAGRSGCGERLMVQLLPLLLPLQVWCNACCDACPS